MNWFSANGISVLSWRSQSADLNPTEHLWEGIKRRMDQTPCRNMIKLKYWVFSTWSAISPNITSNLVDSMVRSCQAVIAARGGSTKY